MPFNLKQVFNVITPQMLARASLYPLRTAVHVARSTQPDARGASYWLAVLKSLRQPTVPQASASDKFVPQGRITGIELSPDGHTTIHTENATLRIVALAPDLLQIRVRPDGMFPEPFSYSVARPESDWPPVNITTASAEDVIDISTGALTLRLSRQTGAMSLLNEDGRPLFTEGTARHQPETGQIMWQACCDPQAAFYGLGEKASALNHAGRRFELWNVDPVGYDRDEDPIYMSIPFVVMLSAGQATGMFFDNTYRAWIDLGASTPGELKYLSTGGELRLYVMAGTPQRVLERYTDLTGRMSLPPLWVLGFHQSRWSYYPQERVLEIAREFRQRQLPCDVIVLDVHHMDGARCFTWSPKHFPNPRAMLEALHQQGFKVVCLVDPGVKVDPGYRVYDQGVAQDHFMKYPDGERFTGPVWPGDCHFADFTDPRTREWWGSLQQNLLDDGVDGIWNDMNEIALITADTPHTWVPSIVQHYKEGHGATHDEIHNVYGLLMNRASCEGLRRLRPEQRPMLFSRSGWAGLQRYAMHWTGDNRSTWDHLHLSIQMVLNLGLSGIAMSGADGGGFSGGPSPELYARWMQVGALTPFFRVHSMLESPDQEPWALGPEVEAISRKYLELRYRLLPYIYTAVWQATQSGLPVMRAMSFVYPEDTTTYSMDDQYLFGDALLVAPVLEEGGRQRAVYLPQGVWYDFWSSERCDGAQAITVDAPLDRLPLFVRGGVVIPLWPVQQFVGEKPIEELELRVYAAPGEYASVFYEDDGIRADYETLDAHRVSRLIVTQTSDRQSLLFNWQVDQGGYVPSYSSVRLHLIGLEQEPAHVTVDQGMVASRVWDEQSRQLTLVIAVAGSFTLQIE
jgi:alpha-glucosidase